MLCNFSRQNPLLGFYVYVYTRNDGTPYYVGKGIGQRAWKRTKKDIKAPIKSGNIIISESNLTEDDAHTLEKQLIGLYGRKDIGTGILRNKTDGGEGTSGIERTKEQCIAISIRLKGTKQTEERKIKQSLALLGHKQSEETKLKRAKSLKGKVRTPQQKLNIKNGINAPEAVLKKKKSLTGKTRTLETKERQREAQLRPEVLAKTKLPKGPQLKTICVYCGKEGGISLMTRYHNKNCKVRTQ